MFASYMGANFRLYLAKLKAESNSQKMVHSTARQRYPAKITIFQPLAYTLSKEEDFSRSGFKNCVVLRQKFSLFRRLCEKLRILQSFYLLL